MRIQSLIIATSMIVLSTGPVRVMADSASRRQADSLQRHMMSLEGEGLLDAYRHLYRVYLYSGDKAGERRVIMQMQREAQLQDNVAAQCLAKAALVNYYANHDETGDSLMLVFPAVHGFLQQHKSWRYYYETWSVMVNAAIFSGKDHFAYREMRNMYEDAKLRKHDYGLGLASYVMANTYRNQGDNDEAIKDYRQSIDKLAGDRANYPAIINILPFYCGALIDEEEYQQLNEATLLWNKLRHDYISRVNGEPSEQSHSVNYIYYCISRGTVLQAMMRPTEGLAYLQRALKLTEGRSDFVRRDVLYRMASFHLREHNYDQALYYNGMASKCKSQLLCYMGDKQRVVRQHGEILFQMGHYEESARLLRQVMDSLDVENLRDIRRELNELNTNYQVDTLRREKQHMRDMSILGLFLVMATGALVLAFVVMGFVSRIRKKNRELLVALDRSEESTRMKDAFIKHVSHEVRTPLNIISGFTQVIGNSDYGLTPEERQSAVAQINENTRQITTLINELLDFSNVESCNYYDVNDDVEVEPLCSALLQTTQQLNNGRLLLSHEVAMGPHFSFHTNREGLEKVLRQLASNALKFTEKGSVVLRVGLSADSRWVEFRVVDTGIGVPEELRERIFEKFYKVNAYKKGLGLGLAVARRIARQLGGSLVVDGQHQAPGTCFVLSLPNR